MSIPDKQENIKSHIEEQTSAKKPFNIKGFFGFLNSRLGHDILIVIILAGVAIIAYSLGITNKKTDRTNVIINSPNQPVKILPAQPENNFSVNSQTKTTNSDASNQSTGKFVASKKGKRYYPVNCPAVKNLSVDNLVYFPSSEEAVAKGYTLSTACE